MQFFREHLAYRKVLEIENSYSLSAAEGQEMYLILVHKRHI
jgi:hypothetical protein